MRRGSSIHDRPAVRQTSPGVRRSGSGFEWRRKRGAVNKTLERIEDVPWNLLIRAPGTEDPVYELVMEVRSQHEPSPWTIRIGQRVPADAEDLAGKGRDLTVAYLEVDEGSSAAVRWPATIDGRFS